MNTSAGPGAQNNNFNMGSIGGPVKAAHHTRPGMGRGPQRNIPNNNG